MPAAGWLVLASPATSSSEWQLSLSLLIPCNPKLAKVQDVTMAEH